MAPWVKAAVDDRAALVNLLLDYGANIDIQAKDEVRNLETRSKSRPVLTAMKYRSLLHQISYIFDVSINTV